MKQHQERLWTPLENKRNLGIHPTYSQTADLIENFGSQPHSNLDNLNLVPHKLLGEFDGDFAILFCEKNREGTKTVGLNAIGQETKTLSSFPEVEQFCLDSEIGSVLIEVQQITIGRLERDLEFFPTFDKNSILNEFRNLSAAHPRILGAYVVSHTAVRPAGDLSVSIGGDCYRTDQVDLGSAMRRTVLLAKAMIRKAATILPETIGLHTGKKGEWLIIEESGRTIQNISNELRVLIGCDLIKNGITFLNALKNKRFAALIGNDKLSEIKRIQPDTASPDTISGQFWGTMCHAWKAMGFDSSSITCYLNGKSGQPGQAVGSLSAVPTGYGVATTTVLLMTKLFKQKPSELSILIEAIGAVTESTIDSLVNHHGIDPAQLTAFDPSPAACEKLRRKYQGIHVWNCTDIEFYGLTIDRRFDVWINNGLGNRVTPEQVSWLLEQGVRLFCGGANNILRKADEKESLEKIWRAGAHIFADELMSGGGWTFALMQLRSRTLGQETESPEFLQTVINQIEQSNTAFVDFIFSHKSELTGQELWEKSKTEIDLRVTASQSLKLTPEEMLRAADIENWGISGKIRLKEEL